MIRTSLELYDLPPWELLPDNEFVNTLGNQKYGELEQGSWVYNANWNNKFCQEFMNLLYCPIFRKFPHAFKYALSLAMFHRLPNRTTPSSSKIISGPLDPNTKKISYRELHFGFLDHVPSEAERSRAWIKNNGLGVVHRDLAAIVIAWDTFQQNEATAKSLYQYKLDYKAKHNPIRSSPLSDDEISALKKDWIIGERRQHRATSVSVEKEGGEEVTSSIDEDDVPSSPSIRSPTPSQPVDSATMQGKKTQADSPTREGDQEVDEFSESTRISDKSQPVGSDGSGVGSSGFVEPLDITKTPIAKAETRPVASDGLEVDSSRSAKTPPVTKTPSVRAETSPGVSSGLAIGSPMFEKALDSTNTFIAEAETHPIGGLDIQTETRQAFSKGADSRASVEVEVGEEEARPVDTKTDAGSTDLTPKDNSELSSTFASATTETCLEQARVSSPISFPTQTKLWKDTMDWGKFVNVDVTDNARGDQERKPKGGAEAALYAKIGDTAISNHQWFEERRFKRNLHPSIDNWDAGVPRWPHDAGFF